MTDPYQVLGVSREATDDEIKAAYRTLAKKYHPDLNGGSAQAEAKMKEVNEAYTLLIKHKGQQGQQGYSQSYGPGAGYGQSYGGSSGQYRGGYGTSDDPFRGQSGDPFGFDPFGFGDFFRRAGQSQQRASYQSDYTEFDPILKRVEDAVLSQSYQRALELLNGIRDRRAAWYYWSAQANWGAGNRVAALNDARTAVQMDPDSEPFRALLNRLESQGRGYRQAGQQQGFGGVLCANPCLTLCVANALCNCLCNCGRGGMGYGFYGC